MRARCAMCGTDTDAGEWILMNRYAVGSGERFSVHDFDDEEGSWVVDRESGGQCEIRGDVLCIDQCLRTWIEGMVIEVESQ